MDYVKLEDGIKLRRSSILVDCKNKMSYRVSESTQKYPRSLKLGRVIQFEHAASRRYSRLTSYAFVSGKSILRLFQLSLDCFESFASCYYLSYASSFVLNLDCDQD